MAKMSEIFGKAIQNKLCTLSQDFFQKERASKAKKKKHTHNEKTHEHFYGRKAFVLKFDRNSLQGGLV